jgi:hypothetical protein
VKKLLFPILTYLNVIILIALILLFIFDQTSGIETIVIYPSLLFPYPFHYPAVLFTRAKGSEASAGK